MKAKSCFVVALICAGRAFGQTPAPSGPVALNRVNVNLTVPSLLNPGVGWGEVSFRGFGGDDKLLYSGLWGAYGIRKGWELDVRGDAAPNGSFTSSTGESIRYGGSDIEVLARYQIPVIGATIQAGVADPATPAQNHRLAGVLGASFGFTFGPSALYIEPKTVFLDHNTLVGIGIGSAAPIARNIEIMYDWTPMVAGRNAIDTGTGNRRQTQITGAGLRFKNLTPGLTLDVGLTNGTGITTGMSMTPSLGNDFGFYVSAGFHF